MMSARLRDVTKLWKGHSLLRAREDTFRYVWYVSQNCEAVVLQDDVTQQIYTQFRNYEEALSDAHSEYYLGKDCWGTRYV